ncbi:MAG: hypothetical protein EA362_12710 [Saprospirales bacterium]|nr:MAG: hypothetical protein EA362_12710 [Saprospirales bacterium]
MGKRFFSSLLSGLLFISTTGVGLHIHVCSQEGVLISFFDTPKCVCSKSLAKAECSAESSCCSLPVESKNQNSDKDPCCEDDFILVVNDTEQVRNQMVSPLLDQEEDSIFGTFPADWVSADITSKHKLFPPGKDPPPAVFDRYLVFCSLLC